MDSFLLTGVVLFGSFFANVLLLQRLADLVSMRLWQTVAQPALRNTAAEIDHVIAAIVTASVFGLLWRDHPVSAVISALLFYLLLLAGGVARLLLLTRRQMQQVETEQFRIENDGLVLCASGLPPGPVVCRLQPRKHQSTAENRWTFSSIAVELFSPTTGLVARNVYYDGVRAAKMLDRLQQCGAAQVFDLALVTRDQDGNYLSLRLGSSWIPLLCGPLRELPPQIRAWWKNLLETDHAQAVEIEEKLFSRYLHPLHLAAESAQLSHPTFLAEFAGLQLLVKNSSSVLRTISGQRLRSLIPATHSPAMDDGETALVVWRSNSEGI